jgi:hypothetical protein
MLSASGTLDDWRSRKHEMADTNTLVSLVITMTTASEQQCISKMSFLFRVFLGFFRFSSFGNPKTRKRKN